MLTALRNRACDSALYTTTYDQIMAEFHCSELMATAGLSTFILGMGISPLFLSPLSEVSAPSPHCAFLTNLA